MDEIARNLGSRFATKDLGKERYLKRGYK